MNTSPSPPERLTVLIMNASPTTEERVWAVFSHLSSLAFGMGIVLPILGWAEQRRKSKYASFQNLQALGYQSLGFTVWILSLLVIAVVAAITALVMLGAENGSGNPDTVLSPWLIFLSVVLFGFVALYILLPIVAAIACALGKDFHYPILGSRLARYVGYDPTQQSAEPAWLIEDHEFRWVAAMGHFSILIMLWGMLAPLTAWMLYGKRSLFLKFQSVQTFVYQASVTAFYFIGALLYFAGISALVVSAGRVGQPTGNSSLGIVGILIFGVLWLSGAGVMLLVPLFHILGQWAGYRVLKGEDYRYPLIGRWVDRWIAGKSAIEENSA